MFLDYLKNVAFDCIIISVTSSFENRNNENKSDLNNLNIPGQPIPN